MSKRRKLGITPDRWRAPKAAPPRKERTELDAKPFVGWLATLGPAVTAADVTGLSISTVCAFLSGRRQRVHIDTVDHACLNAGIRIDDLYPYEGE